MDFLRNPLLVWLNDLINNALDHKRELFIGACSVLVIGLLGAGYIFYKNKARTQAYKDFIEALRYYDGVTAASKDRYPDPNSKIFSTELDKWQQTAQAFEQGYQKHSGSELGGMFLAFRSEALLNLGKADEAMAALEQAIAKIPSDEVKDYYKVKLALLKIDKNSEEGLTILQQLADNEDSAANSLALYQLGSYYWNQKKFNDARNFWQRLLVKSGGEKSGRGSVFLQEVKEKLSLFSVENL